MQLVRSTFLENECTYLLKDLTGKIPMTPFDTKENNISKGTHYSEMIYEENPVSSEVDEIFITQTKKYATEIADMIKKLSMRMYDMAGERMVIVSIARAGSPIGVLIKKYLSSHGIYVPHYSISVIREKGIDTNALDYIREKHPTGIIVFVDGWTGKGSIRDTLCHSVLCYNSKNNTHISTNLAVVSDPARRAEIAATRKDICIPNACLNSTVSGLVSRTVCNDAFMDEGDFHGAVYYEKLKPYDRTEFFIDAISSEFTYSGRLMDRKRNKPRFNRIEEWVSTQVISDIAHEFPLMDRNKIKLGIGETSRALIRRTPVGVLVNPKTDEDKDQLLFIRHLASEKKIPVTYGNIGKYNCAVLIK